MFRLFVFLCVLICLTLPYSCSARTVNSVVDSWQLQRPEIVFDPSKVTSMTEDEQSVVRFMIKENNNSVQIPMQDIAISVFITIKPERPDIVQIVDNSTFLTCLRSGQQTNYTFSIKGIFLGYSKVFVTLHPFVGKCLEGETITNFQHHTDWYGNSNNSASKAVEVYHYEYLVSVSPAPSLLADIFTGIMALIIAVNYVNMGCQLELSSIWNVLKKPVGPVIGFVCQFTFMPLAAYGIGYLMFRDPNLRLGLFTLGCSPGGSMSNFWTLLFNGDINLSVAMTFISTVAALGMMPLWIFTLGKTLFRNGEVTLPYLNLAGSLLMLTLPIGIGLVIRRYKPIWAQLSEKLIRPFTIFCILLGLTIGCYVSRYIFIMFTWQIVVAGLAVAWGGYTFGALSAWIARLKRPQIIAVAIETAFQNGGVAFVMLILSLPQPDAALTAVPVVAQLIVTGLPMWCILLVMKTTACVKKCSERKEDEKKPIPDNHVSTTDLPEKIICDKETRL